MADGINRIFGGSNYNIGGFANRQNKQEVEEKDQQVVVNNYEETQIDPNKMMELLDKANNMFVTEKKSVKPVELAADVQERVLKSMEDFEKIYNVARAEVGDNLALAIMDMM